MDIRQPAYPKVVWTGIFTYTAGPFSLYLQEHYIDGGYVNPTDIVGVTIDNNSVSPAWYTDLRLSYAFKNGWEVYAQGINLLDQDPPVTPQLGVQTNTGYYDVKGQRFVVGRAPGAVILGRQGSKIVYDLSQLIIRGSLAPGAMLTEAELALRFGVSRTPIRQALGILLEEGLLQRTSGRGFTVRKFAQREILDAIEVRAVLEGLAVRSLAEKKSVARVIRELDEILGLEAAPAGTNGNQSPHGGVGRRLLRPQHPFPRHHRCRRTKRVAHLLTGKRQPCSLCRGWFPGPVQRHNRPRQCQKRAALLHLQPHATLRNRRRRSRRPGGPGRGHHALACAVEHAQSLPRYAKHGLFPASIDPAALPNCAVCGRSSLT